MQHVDHTQNIIELQNIAFSYNNNPVLNNITFSLHKGDYLGIIGPNGGGKTTLLKIMLGLLNPTKGTVQLFGKPLNQFREWSKIGYVPQKASHFDQNFPATVEEVVSMGRFAKRGLFHSLTNEDKQKVHLALEHVDMLANKNKQISSISGGQQQRVFIARALANEPEIIFLDEPTVGVDINTQEQFYLLLQKLNKELDLTLVLVSHELDVVAREATEVACVNNKLVCYCKPNELVKSGGLERLYGKELKYILHQHQNR